MSREEELAEMGQRVAKLEKRLHNIFVRKIIDREIELQLITEKDKAKLEVELQDEAKYSLDALEHIFRLLQASNKQ